MILLPESKKIVQRLVNLFGRVYNWSKVYMTDITQEFEHKEVYEKLKENPLFSLTTSTDKRIYAAQKYLH